MKTLYLLRHAKSSWEDESLSDFDRPLNKRGQRQAPAMGALMAHLNLPIDAWLLSPARRTEETVAMIRQHLPHSEGPQYGVRKLYEANWRHVLDCIKACKDTHKSLLVCGHNPELTELLNRLSDATIDNLPTCGLAVLRFDVDRWKDCGQETGKLQLFLTPKGIRGD